MKYKSEIFETIHESAAEKFKIGAISKERMREYDDMCIEAESGISAHSNAVRETDKIEHPGLVAV